MDVEVEEWTGQGVQRNGSSSITSGQHPALWKILAEDTLYCTSFPQLTTSDWFVTTTSGQNNNKKNCMKIGRHKHPC